jgi:diadenosine tetraphosphate (Ap4A) HIT family hydrolase
MSSGWAVLGDPQVRPGYCLLYPDPVVATLNDLTSSDRAAFLQDMCKLGDAVLAVTGATRINYEILGNLEPALHAHLIPRSITEPEEVRTKPIWLEDWSVVPPFDPEFHGELKAKLQKELGL